jgi:hypothetical protein
LAVAETFPNSFLGVMLHDPTAVVTNRKKRSDAFFKHLIATGTLQNLLSYLLPGRATVQPLGSVTNHDDRAALVCALTALAFAAGDFTAVGDDDGWIVLPPRCFVQDWAWDDLAADARDERPGCLYQTPSWRQPDASQPEGHTEETACDEKGAVTMSVNAEALIEKIRAMPEEQLYEVEDFVDFIRLREQQRALTRDAAAASAAAFAAIWDNPEDDVYDAL